jgi:hypothetical protein
VSYADGFGTADGTLGTEMLGFAPALKPPELTGTEGDGGALMTRGALGAGAATDGVGLLLKPPDEDGLGLDRGAENPPDDDGDDDLLLELLLLDEELVVVLADQA